MKIKLTDKEKEAIKKFNEDVVDNYDVPTLQRDALMMDFTEKNAKAKGISPGEFTELVIEFLGSEVEKAEKKLYNIADEDYCAGNDTIN